MMIPDCGLVFWDTL